MAIMFNQDSSKEKTKSSNLPVDEKLRERLIQVAHSVMLPIIESTMSNEADDYGVPKYLWDKGALNCTDSAEERTSEAALNEILTKKHGIGLTPEYARKFIAKDDSRVFIRRKEHMDCETKHLGFAAFKDVLSDHGYTNVKCSSHLYYYAPGHYLGWHTNMPLVGGIHRCYIVWTDTGDSHFIYRDPETKEVLQDQDKVGFNIRIFGLNNNKPYWHCVKSNCHRFAIGFKITDPEHEQAYDISQVPTLSPQELEQLRQKDKEKQNDDRSD